MGCQARPPLRKLGIGKSRCISDSPSLIPKTYAISRPYLCSHDTVLRSKPVAAIRPRNASTWSFASAFPRYRFSCAERCDCGGRTILQSVGIVRKAAGGRRLRLLPTDCPVVLTGGSLADCLPVAGRCHRGSDGYDSFDLVAVASNDDDSIPLKPALLSLGS